MRARMLRVVLQAAPVRRMRGTCSYEEEAEEEEETGGGSSEMIVGVMLALVDLDRGRAILVDGSP